MKDFSSAARGCPRVRVAEQSGKREYLHRSRSHQEADGLKRASLPPPQDVTVPTRRSISPDAKIALLRRGLQAKPHSQMVLLRLAEALAEKGESKEAAETFRRAYRLGPFPWLGPLGTAPQGLRDAVAAMVGHGAIFSSTIATLAIAEAHLGHTDEVKRLVDYDRFFQDTMLEPPSGFELADFNAALAAEIKSNLTYYHEPEGRAIRNAWRDDDVMRSQRPACRAFAAAIRLEAERYIASLPKSTDHPFVKSCPADFGVEGWANVSDGTSHHVSHIHCRAWASGVYYVVEPAIARDPGGQCGWLHLGPPEHLGVSTQQGWAERLIAPRPGRLVLMPGYFFHHTWPMGVDEERICIAFDVVPTEIATTGSDAVSPRGAGPSWMRAALPSASGSPITEKRIGDSSS
jgi:hypothetical protein